MDITVHPNKLRGSISAIASKSYAHRLLICSAFSDRETSLICTERSLDIEATASCLNALGANISANSNGYHISPIAAIPDSVTLPCGESGSTLRFLLPIVGALGVDATFLMKGRLPDRPLHSLWEEMERMGCVLTRPTRESIRCCGKLSSGVFYIDGSISSQFISGLLFAGMLMEGTTTVQCEKPVSFPYIQITKDVLQQFGIHVTNLTIAGKQHLRSPGEITVEGDWSNSAFFLAANYLGSCIEVSNLNEHSTQGDRKIADLLPILKNHCTISVAHIPDLVPILAVVASANSGAVFTDTGRLRHKESDRLDAVAQMLRALGGCVDIQQNAISIRPGTLHGGTVNTFGDHRIAMAAAIAATVADGPVRILDADCVSKSYPGFWEDYKKLGGNYEQYIW